MATKGKELSELGSILSVSANTANIDGSLIVGSPPVQIIWIVPFKILLYNPCSFHLSIRY